MKKRKPPRLKKRKPPRRSKNPHASPRKSFARQNFLRIFAKEINNETEKMIRNAQERDIPALLSLLEQVCLVHHDIRPDLFRGPATKYSAAQLRHIIACPETPVFVLTDAADVVRGYAFCQHKQIVGDAVLTDVRTLYIDDICVDAEARGQHVGQRLYEHVLDYARREGFYNVTLNVWEGNDAARAFYDRMGLRPQRTTLETIL